MLHAPISVSRSLAFLILSVGLAATSVAQTQTTASAYTITKVVDSATLLPDGSGTFTVSGVAYEGAAALFQPEPVIDGSTVVFFDPVDQTADNLTHGVLWSAQVTGAPNYVRLVDSSTTAPGNSGPFVAGGNGENLSALGIGNGTLLFAGVSTNDGGGLYSVPTAGGAVTTLVNAHQTQPNLARGSSFEHLIGGVIRGGTVAFSVFSNDNNDGGGTYEIPATGGAYLVFGDKSDPITGDPAGNLFAIGTRIALNASTLAFVGSTDPSGDQGAPEAIYTAPATGLTVNPTTGFVNNATRIAGAETLVPGDPQNRTFDPRGFSVSLDDSGAVVFSGYPVGTSLSSTGLYVSVNGVVNRLVDLTTSLPGDTGHFSSLFVPPCCDSNGVAAFYAAYTRGDGTYVDGLYTVPVGGGSVVKVVETGDTLADGSVLNGADFGQACLSGDGKIVFHASFTRSGSTASLNGIFVATPGGGSGGTSNTLILSTHTGGDTGPVTLTVTRRAGSTRAGEWRRV